MAGRWLRGQAPGPRVAYLVYFANTRCEQDCTMCFVRPEADDALLTQAELRRVGGGLRHLLQLTVTGGEPSLRPDLVAAVTALAGAAGVPLVSLHSNGFAPQRVERCVRGIVAGLPASVVWVRLSLDAVGARHDQIRRRGGSWERALESLERLEMLRSREPRLRLFVDVCLSAHNRDQMRELGAFLHSRAAALDGWELLLQRGSPRDPGAAADPAWFRRAWAELGPGPTASARGETLRSLPEAARQALYRRRADAAQGAMGPPGCVGGKRFAVLGATGEVLPCETLGGAGDLGNVRDHGLDLERVLRGAPARRVRRGIARGDCAPGCSEECPALATALLRSGGLATTWWGAIRARPGPAPAGARSAAS